MDLTLYTFSKRRNSTARPSGGATYSGALREPCDTLAPSIGLDLGQASNPAAYNYAYVSDFGRYYWISSWTWESGLWWCNLTVDVLASWKTQIGSSSNYVLRCTGRWNGDIVDNMYPATGYHTSQSVDIAQSFGGCYVVGVVAGAAGVNGAISFLQFSPAEFAAFATSLLSTIEWTGADFQSQGSLSEDGLTEVTFKALFNPAQYIQSCKWMPFAPVQPSSLSSTPLGWWTVDNATCHPVSVRRYTQVYSVTLPQHPQASTRGNYLNLEPFTRYTLKIQPFGNFVIDTSRVARSHSIEIYIEADIESGIGILEIFSGDGATSSDKDLLIYAEKKIGVDIALAQQSQDIFSAASSLITGGAAMAQSALALNPVGIIEGGSGGIMNAISAFTPRVQVLGSSSGFASYDGTSYLTADFNAVVDEDPAQLGKPLCQVAQLSTLPGYQLIASPDVLAPCTHRELTEITDFLASGYFFE